MISTTYVTAQVALIREMAEKGDDEAAHGLEDDIYREVLEAIAKGHWQSLSLATEAIKSQDIEFARCCS